MASYATRYRANNVENFSKRFFGVVLHYAVCHTCQSWVKSSTGQFGWQTRAQRNRVAKQHREMHNA